MDPIHPRRLPSLRLHGWDYAQSGRYFITIGTHHRVRWFGHIQKGIVCVSDAGSVVHACWTAIPRHFPYVSLDAFIVMPDHLHGIIIIRPSDSLESRSDIGTIIQQFKRACTARIHMIHPLFRWHRNFNDHVIRDQGEYERIQRYILNNPTKLI